MDKRVIFFTGLKGGVGRTVLTRAFAAFLVSKGISVTVVDADEIYSIYRERNRCLKEYPNTKQEYGIVPLDCKTITSIETAKDFLDCTSGTVYLVDCRFNHDYGNLMYLYQTADMIVLPFQYDSMCADSTYKFMAYLSKKGIYAPTYLLPNMCGRFYKKESDSGIRSQILCQKADILPEISYCPDLGSFSSIDNYEKKIEKATTTAFHELLDKMQVVPILQSFIEHAEESAKIFEEDIDACLKR